MELCQAGVMSPSSLCAEHPLHALVMMQHSLVYKSKTALRVMRAASTKEAAPTSARLWRTISSFRSEWRSLLRNLLVGDYRPVVTRGVLFGDLSTSTKSRGAKLVLWPAIIMDGEGQRHWGMIQQPQDQREVFLRTWQLRDLLTVRFTPTFITVVAVSDGAMLWQNAASMSMFGE